MTLCPLWPLQVDDQHFTPLAELVGGVFPVSFHLLRDLHDSCPTREAHPQPHFKDPGQLSCTLEPLGEFKTHWYLDPTPRDSDVIGLGVGCASPEAPHLVLRYSPSWKVLTQTQFLNPSTSSTAAQLRPLVGGHAFIYGF